MLYIRTHGLKVLGGVKLKERFYENQIKLQKFAKTTLSPVNCEMCMYRRNRGRNTMKGRSAPRLRSACISYFISKMRGAIADVRLKSNYT